MPQMKESSLGQSRRFQGSYRVKVVGHVNPPLTLIWCHACADLWRSTLTFWPRGASCSHMSVRLLLTGLGQIGIDSGIRKGLPSWNGSLGGLLLKLQRGGFWTSNSKLAHFILSHWGFPHCCLSNIDEAVSLNSTGHACPNTAIS